MSFDRYPAYRTAREPWLGELPADWPTAPLKYLVAFSGGGTPDKDNPDFWDGDIPWVSPKDMKRSWITDSADHLSLEGLLSSATKLIPAGAVLVVVRSGILKHSIPVAINGVPVCLNQDMKAFSTGQQLDARYLRYLVAGSERALLALWSKQGATVESIEHEYLANSEIPVPTLDEQTAIANFLDRETARIDRLIERQERLIALLKEKRQAVISQAVTRGLDPTVPMKDSGVEWLGAVPGHWNVSQLRYVKSPSTAITYGIVQAGPDVEGGIPYIRTGDMSGDALPIDGYLRTSEEVDFAYRRSKVFHGDLVIAIRATVGKCLPLPESLHGANLTQGTAKFSPGPHVHRDFVRYFLESPECQRFFQSISKGATFKEITLDALRRVAIPLPTREEQSDIVEFLDKRLSTFNDVIRKTEEASRLLQERRTALISAAVTGKIDVRTHPSARPLSDPEPTAPESP